jgi:hypothetical protein
MSLKSSYQETRVLETRGMQKHGKKEEIPDFTNTYGSQNN